MLHRLETMKQPNGSTVTIDIEQIDGYSDDELEKYGEKHRFYAELTVDFGYGSFHCPRHYTKTLYSDKLGYYTYKSRKSLFIIISHKILRKITIIVSRIKMVVIVFH